MTIGVVFTRFNALITIIDELVWYHHSEYCYANGKVRKQSVNEVQSIIDSVSNLETISRQTGYLSSPTRLDVIYRTVPSLPREYSFALA